MEANGVLFHISNLIMNVDLWENLKEKKGKIIQPVSLTDIVMGAKEEMTSYSLKFNLSVGVNCNRQELLNYESPISVLI